MRPVDLPNAPGRKKRQRLAERMVEDMEERRKNADPAQAHTQTDYSEMLDAAVGQQAFDILLEQNKGCGHNDGNQTEQLEQMQAPSRAAGGDFDNGHIAQDAIKGRIQHESRKER